MSRLTALKVQRASTPGRYGDGGNLYLQVSPTGTKAWIFRYRLPGSISRTGKPRSREMGLGSLDTFSLAEARERARHCRQLVAQGIDPITDRDSRSTQGAWTFSRAVDAFMEQPRWRNPKHRAQWRATISRYVLPIIGNVPVAQVTRQHLLAILTPIWFQKNETANRVRGRIEMVLDWCKAHGHRPDEATNPAAFKGNLAHALPAKSKVAAVRHHPALPHAELPAFLSALSAQSGLAALALRLTILTASRTGEVIGMRWGEVDLEQRLWTIPAERMKSKRPHQVPLSDQAVELLTQLKGKAGLGVNAGAFVFAGVKPGKHINNVGMLKLIWRMGRADITIHGFRSTFRTWAAEATDYPREVCEAALAHVVGDKVEIAYMRTTFFEKRVRMMQQWGAFCAGDAGTAKVIKLRK
jgi:integrase